VGTAGFQLPTNPEKTKVKTVVPPDPNPSGAEAWVATLKERPKDKPFFLWLASIDPHRDYAEKVILEPHRPEDVTVMFAEPISTLAASYSNSTSRRSVTAFRHWPLVKVSISHSPELVLVHSRFTSPSGNSIVRKTLSTVPSLSRLTAVAAK
jgi:tRNA A37 threonylcarbamoyladenosine synthetase subunit TsaC/SUA5/YrdC